MVDLPFESGNGKNDTVSVMARTLVNGLAVCVPKSSSDTLLNS